MARTSAADSPTLGTPREPDSVLPPGLHKGLIVTQAAILSTSSGNKILKLTVVDGDPESATAGDSHTDIVPGSVSKNGKAPWIQRVMQALAAIGLTQLPKIEGDKQPADDCDWEESADVASCVVGVVISARVEVETYNGEDKNRLSAISFEPSPILSAVRKGATWAALRDKLASTRAEAVDGWRKNLEIAANPDAPAAGFDDDDVPF